MSPENKDSDKLLGDHNYDGIQEYDNPMPRWWVNLFWATIVFSIGYCLYYMPGFGPSVEQEYQMEVSNYEATKPVVARPAAEAPLADQLLAYAKNPDAIAKGKEVFASRCIACHADRGQGLIGPNLTDGVWIHGGSLEEIFHVVTKGVPEKGMIPWENQLTDDERMNVVAFIRSIQNTNIEGKAPEGEPAEPTPLFQPESNS